MGALQKSCRIQGAGGNVCFIQRVHFSWNVLHKFNYKDLMIAKARKTSKANEIQGAKLQLCMCSMLLSIHLFAVAARL